MDPAALAQAKRHLEESIPALPGTVLRLLHSLEDDESSVSELAEIISHDPTLTARVLRVANSAYYGFSGQVSSLPKAVVLIGVRMLRSIGLSIPAVHGLTHRGVDSPVSLEGLWIHSLAVATAMQHLARSLGMRGCEHLFVVGMLHDIGKVLMAELFPNEYGHALELVRSGRYEYLFQAEQDLVGADHAELAGLLLTYWKFPAMIAAPVAAHHGEDYPEPRPPDSALLRVANHLVQELDMGGEGNRVPVGILPRDGELLTLTASILDETRRHLEERRSGIEEFYSAIT